MAETFPYVEGAGTQGLVETPMFPDTPLPTVPANIEEVTTQAALVEASHSGKDFNDQKDTTVNTIQSIGMDETRRSIAKQEQDIQVKAAEQQVRQDPNEISVQHYQDVLKGTTEPPNKFAMEQAVVNMITPSDRKGYFTSFNERRLSQDLAARNNLYSVIGESSQNANFWDKVLAVGRDLVGFINTRAISSSISDALDTKNTLSNWVSADEVINDFRNAYAVASPEKKVELIQALKHGLERTSSFFGDPNAAQVAINLERILTQTRSQSVENSIMDIAGLPLVTTARLLLKGVRVAAELGKPANIALKAANTEVAVDLMASDAIKGTKISGMSSEEIARKAVSMNMTPTEMDLVNLEVPQKMQDKLRQMAGGLREQIDTTLMPSSVTPVQRSRAAEYYDNLYDTVRNKSIYKYTPKDFKEGYFTGEIKWQSQTGEPFLTEEAANSFGREFGKTGNAEMVGTSWKGDEKPVKIGPEQRIYSTGGQLDVTGKVVGGNLPTRPSDTKDTFWLFGTVKRDKQGRYFYTQQQYAVPGQQWVFTENIKNPLPLESIGIHTLSDVSSRNWWNAGIPMLAASKETVTQRGIGRSAQAKIVRNFANEYKNATKGLPAKEHVLVDKALVDGDALSNSAGAYGYVFNVSELKAKGLSDLGIESYYRQRILRDTSWLYRVRTMIHDLKSQGMFELAFDGNEFAQALHTPAKPMPLAIMKSLNTQGKVGKVLNTMDGVVLNLTSENLDALYAHGGQVVKLYKPQVVNGRKFTHVIIDPTKTKLREITSPLGYRPGEFARMYSDEYFITVSRRVEDEFGRQYGTAGYSGEVARTIRTAPSAKQAKTFAEAHQEALRIATSEISDADKLKLIEQQIGKYTDAKAFLEDVKSGKFGKDEVFGFHYTRDTHSYLQDTVDESLTNGRLFYSKRGEKLLSTDPSRKNTLDVKQSLGIELANVSRFMTSKDIRIDAIEKWMNSFGDGLIQRTYNNMADFINSPLDASKIKEGLLAKKAAGELSAVEDLTQLSSKELLKFAESERSYIKHQLHIRTQAQKTAEADYRGMTEFITGKASHIFPEDAMNWLGVKMRSANVPDFLRQANFVATLAMGNVSQLLVQLNGALISMGRHPIIGLPSLKTATLMRVALMSDNVNVWKTLATADNLTSLGLKNTQEFIDSVRAVRDSGILADIKSTALFNVEDGAIDLYSNKAKTLYNEASPWFFNRGEELSRLTSWEIARREWSKANPGQSWQSSDALRAISAKQKEYNVGMQSHNTAVWQQGWWGIPFQFAQYNVKLLAGILHAAAQFGKEAHAKGLKGAWIDMQSSEYRMFDPKMALSVLATQALIYGAAGNSLKNLAQQVWGDGGSLTEGQRMAVAEGLVAGAVYAATEAMDGEAAKLAVGTRFGSFNWYGQIYDKIVSDKGSISDVVFGVTKSNGIKLFDHVLDLGKLFYYHQATPELIMESLGRFPEVFASYSNSLKAYTYLQKEGVVTSKDGTPIARINSKENLAAFLGISTVQVQEYYDTIKDSQHLYSTLNELAKKVYAIQLRERKAQEEGDIPLYESLMDLRIAMMPTDEAHARYVTKQLRDKLWPGDTMADKFRRNFQDKMHGAVNEFRVLRDQRIIRDQP